jgi:hypothetical protein
MSNWGSIVALDVYVLNEQSYYPRDIAKYRLVVTMLREFLGAETQGRININMHKQLARFGDGASRTEHCIRIKFKAPEDAVMFKIKYEKFSFQHTNGKFYSFPLTEINAKTL